MNTPLTVKDRRVGYNEIKHFSANENIFDTVESNLSKVTVGFTLSGFSKLSSGLSLKLNLKAINIKPDPDQVTFLYTKTV